MLGHTITLCVACERHDAAFNNPNTYNMIATTCVPLQPFHRAPSSGTHAPGTHELHINILHVYRCSPVTAQAAEHQRSSGTHVTPFLRLYDTDRVHRVTLCRQLCKKELYVYPVLYRPIGIRAAAVHMYFWHVYRITTVNRCNTVATHPLAVHMLFWTICTPETLLQRRPRHPWPLAVHMPTETAENTITLIIYACTRTQRCQM